MTAEFWQRRAEVAELQLRAIADELGCVETAHVHSALRVRLRKLQAEVERLEPFEVLVQSTLTILRERDAQVSKFKAEVAKLQKRVAELEALAGFSTEDIAWMREASVSRAPWPPLTPRERDRWLRALKVDWNNRDSLVDAIRGLQSTDSPALVPLHNALQARLRELEEESK